MNKIPWNKGIKFLGGKSNPAYKHGNSLRGKKTTEYYTWVDIRQRCNNENDSRYKDYGGRGIRVCERWNEFVNFLEDMGKRPLNKTLDRIDNDGNYCPENCRWATTVEQNNNKRNNRIITFNNKTMTLPEWARFLQIPADRLKKRLRDGMPLNKALTNINYHELRKI